MTAPRATSRKVAGELAYRLRYECKVCKSTARLFNQCSPCLQKFIAATDVATKSKYYNFTQLFVPRVYE